MDAAVLLLLPLVGGYAFARVFNATRYLAAREEGHRLYFRAAFWGFALFLMSLLLRLLLTAESQHYRDLEESLRSLLTPFIKDADKGNPLLITLTSIGALVLGVPLGKFLNLFFWEGYWLKKAIQHDYLEQLLNRATAERRPIAIAMKSRKVYVGFVLRTFDPAQDRKWIAILPLASGYRDKDDLRLAFTTNYQDVYGNILPTDGHLQLPSPLAHLSPKDFEVILPFDEVQSINLFDLVAYNAFSPPKSPAVKPGGHPNASESVAKT